MSTNKFAAYLRGLLKDGTFALQKDLAEALGMKQARLSRVINEKDQYTFNVENCLRVAHVTGRAPAEVLRAAGKEEIATLLEALFPQAGKALPPREYTLLTRFRAMPDDAQDVVLELSRVLAEPARETKRKSS